MLAGQNEPIDDAQILRHGLDIPAIVRNLRAVIDELRIGRVLRKPGEAVEGDIQALARLVLVEDQHREHIGGQSVAGAGRGLVEWAKQRAIDAVRSDRRRRGQPGPPELGQPKARIGDRVGQGVQRRYIHRAQLFAVDRHIGDQRRRGLDLGKLIHVEPHDPWVVDRQDHIGLDVPDDRPQAPDAGLVAAQPCRIDRVILLERVRVALIVDRDHVDRPAGQAPRQVLGDRREAGMHRKVSKDEQL